MRCLWTVLIAPGLLGTAVAVRAQEADPLAIHGFGGNAYGETDGNPYVPGNDEGDFHNARMAMAFIATPAERLRISTQIALVESHGTIEPELDYAFAEWRFSDGLKLHAGRAKQPFGIYTEIFEVGTLRPFFTLPQGIYGPTGIVAEAYHGLGLTGRWRHRRGWALHYDIYGGGLVVGGHELARAHDLTPGSPDSAGMAEEEETESIRQLLGGRLNVETPFQGLVLGASAFTGVEKPPDKEEEVRRSVYGLHGEYLAEPWSLRSEHVWHAEGEDVRTRAFYLEVARRIGGPWQVAARFDWLDVKAPSIALLAPSLARHKELAASVNYWFHPGFVVKLSYHHVEGNRFAHPEDAELDAAIESGSLKTRTDLVVVGAQFSF